MNVADDASDERASVDPVIASHERYRRKAPLRWGCGVALGLVTLAAIAVAVPMGFYLYYGVTDRQAYERELALLRDADEPLTVEAIEAYYPTDPAIERTTQFWLDAIARLDGEYAADAEPLYLVGEKLKNETEFDERGLLAGDDLADAAAFVERHRAAIELAHAARRSGTTARYPLAFEKLFAYDGKWMFDLTRLLLLLWLDAEVRLAQGDDAAAGEDVLSALAAGESLRNEPLLISQLLRANVVTQASIAACRLVGKTTLSDERLAELQAAFASVDMTDGFRRGLRGDRFMALHTLRGDSPIGDPAIEEFANRWFPDASAAKVLEFYRMAEEATRESLLGMEDAQVAIDAEVERVRASSFGSLRYRPLELLSPMFDTVSLAASNAQTRANLAAAALACERYRLAQGSWPNSLDDLTPEYLADVPLDPFVERPLRYLVDADGVRVYSIGADRIDVGGVEDDLYHEEGDIVVRLPTERPGKDLP